MEVIAFIILIVFFTWIVVKQENRYNKVVEELLEERDKAAQWKTTARLHGYEEK